MFLLIAGFVAAHGLFHRIGVGPAPWACSVQDARQSDEALLALGPTIDSRTATALCALERKTCLWTILVLSQ